MIMNLYLRLFSFYLVFCVFIIGCSREKSNIYSTNTLNINLEYTEYENTVDFKSGNEVGKVYKEEIPYNDDLYFEVSISSLPKSQFKSTSFRRVIPVGTTFRILVFDENNKYLLSGDYICGSLITTNIQLQANKNYSFIVYSFGKLTALPSLAINVGDDISVAKLLLSSFEDVMSHTILNRVINQNNNTLSFVLKHTFTKIKTTIDASTVGLINSIGNFSVTNTFSNAEVKYTNQPTTPFNLNFSNLIPNRNLSSFVVSNDNKSALSDEQLIYADGIQSQSLMLSAMSVNNIPKTNVTLLNYVFKPGVYYDINIKLKSTKPDGYLIGDLYWALGNLILENGVYKPASNQGEMGDYWLRADRGLTDGTAGYYYKAPINKASPQVSGSGTKVLDICNLVGPGWRLPTYLEADALQAFASWHNSPINKYVGYYTKPNSTDSVYGVYFGTKVRPTISNQDNFLFVPFAGAYNSGVMYDYKSVGFYWHTGMDGNQGTSFQFASGYMSSRNNGGLDDRRANSVRCVKSK